MKELWEKFFGPSLTVEGGEAVTSCPLCGSKASFTIQVEEDTCQCKGCGYKANFKQFQTFVLGGKTQKVFFAEGGIKSLKPRFIRLDRVSAYQAQLEKSEKWTKFLKEERLLEDQAITDFRLGLNENRIIIPIPDLEGRIQNLRRYDPFDTTGNKVLSVKGFGGTHVFPSGNLKGEKSILFLEGEMDCLLANQLGYNAITLTSGVSARLPDQYLKYFRGREVFICFDIQEVSNLAARRMMERLSPYAKSIRLIHLPEELGKKGDFTDFFRMEHTKEDFDALLKREIIEVTLENLVAAEHLNRTVRTVGKISGLEDIPFLIPRTVVFHCKVPGSKKDCTTCLLFVDQEIEIADDNAINLELILAPSKQVKGILKSLIAIPRGCSRNVDLEISEGRNVEGIRIVPEKLMVGSGRYVVRHGFYMDHGLRANARYELEGIVVPEPRQQYASFLIYSARSEANPLDVMPSDFSQLKIFQPGELKIEQKLAQGAFELQQNVTQIYDRSDMIQAVNMVYFTPTAFTYQKQFAHRGWGDILIIGDSRQGKSATVQKLFSYYGLGEVISGEGSSLAGLRGGCSQVGKTWHLQWGVIPLNDRGIVAIDETQNLDPDIFSALSRIRSEGIAEIVMIKTEKTLSRTRLIFIANPKSNRNMASWPEPIRALESFGWKAPDLARFDFIVTVGEGEVPLERIKELQDQGKTEERIPQNLWRMLILWSWSRKPEQIVFAKDVEDYIFETARKLSRDFKAPIPIVKGSEERFIIAKYAVAIAAQLFSTDGDYEQIIVTDQHVDFVDFFFRKVFSKSSCQLDEYALLAQQQNVLADEEYLRKILQQYGGQNLINALLYREYLSFSDWQDLLGTDRSTTAHITSSLVQGCAIRKPPKTSAYVKTPAFINFLKAMRDEVPF